MKKISSESAAVPTVSINFGYFIETKFMLFTGERYEFRNKCRLNHYPVHPASGVSV